MCTVAQMGKGKKQAHAKRANVPSGNALDVRIRGSEAAVGLIVDAGGAAVRAL